MRRRSFLASLAATALRGQARRTPNVLLLLFDKCRADAIGAYGRSEPQTPSARANAIDLEFEPPQDRKRP
jgi:hypothetical protein